MKKILFRSTNRKAADVDFREALLRGQAPDYGLYMPLSFPQISREKIESFKDMEYHRVACEVMKPFLAGEVDFDYMKKLACESYDFEVPLQKAGKNFYLMWLTKGPTASFKDFAARFMSGLMAYFAEKEKKTLTVLVATSGDTGGAVADAFCGRGSVRVIVLFPHAEVTEMQRRQMTSSGGNIIPFSVDGKFDDCQAMVKTTFNDSRLNFLNLTSANSINIGRLIPQSVYYFYGYSLAGEKNIAFSVPSGNFGNLMGGVFARKMGLPVKKFIVGVNENDEFPRFLATGIYSPVSPSVQCSSNAMNVGHPSNLARLVDLYGGWLYDERDGAGNVLRKGVLKIMPDMEKLRKDFVSYSIKEKEVDKTMLEFYQEHGIILEPHGAVAACAAKRYNGSSAVISLETADPAKFPQKISRLLKVEPQPPQGLCGVAERDEHYIAIENSYSSFREKLIKLFS